MRSPVSFGGLQRLDRKDEGAFRAHVAVGFRIEGVAPAVRADDAQSIEGSTHPGCAQIVGGPDQGLLAVPAAKRVHGCVQGGQAGGTRRAVGGRRAHQVEVVGDAVGQHRQADGDHVKLGGAIQGAPVGDRRNLRADEDTGGAVAQVMKIPAGLLGGLPGATQQHPDLRVHGQHFVMGESEETPVEELLPIFSDQALVRTGEAPRAGESTDGSIAPAVAFGDRLADDLRAR